MKCPFCEKEMRKGILSSNDRCKIFWEPENEKLGIMDRMFGKGIVEADYSLAKFKIQHQYYSRYIWAYIRCLPSENCTKRRR